MTLPTAPVLTVTGKLISWRAQAGVGSWVFVRKVPGKADEYRTITGTSITPPDVPGATVRYSLRANVPNAPWAKEVSITYATATPPPPPAPAPTAGPQIGFNGSYTSSASTDWVGKLAIPYETTGAKLVRLDYSRLGSGDTLATTLGIARRHQAKVILLVPDNAVASSIAPVVKANLAPDELIEYGNETWAGTTTATIATAAAAYGQRAKAFMDALHAAGIPNKVIVQGDPAARGTGWFDGLYSAFPGVHAHPQFGGFSIHPYGPALATASMDGYRNRLAAQHTQATAHGAPADVPIYLTEYGISSDNGRTLDSNYGWPVAMTFDQVAVALAGALDDFATLPYAIRAVIVFQDIDQAAPGASTNRESYFGFVNRGGTPKTPIVAMLRDRIAAGVA